MINITMYCTVCGDEMSVEWASTPGDVRVEPCKSCTDKAHYEGFESGRKEPKRS
jgi:hypothetical protein